MSEPFAAPSMEQKVDFLLAHVARQGADIAWLVADNGALRTEITWLRTDNSRLTSEVARLGADNVRLDAEVARLGAANVRLDAGNVMLKAEVARLDAGNGMLKLDVARLTDDNCRLTDDNVAFKERLDSAEKETADVKTVLREVEQRLLMLDFREASKHYLAIKWGLQPLEAFQRLKSIYSTAYPSEDILLSTHGLSIKEFSWLYASMKIGNNIAHNGPPHYHDENVAPTEPSPSSSSSPSSSPSSSNSSKYKINDHSHLAQFRQFLKAAKLCLPTYEFDIRSWTALVKETMRAMKKNINKEKRPLAKLSSATTSSQHPKISPTLPSTPAARGSRLYASTASTSSGPGSAKNRQSPPEQSRRKQ